MKISIADLYRSIGPASPVFGDLVIVTDIRVVNGNPANDVIKFKSLSGVNIGSVLETRCSTFLQDFREYHYVRKDGYPRYWAEGDERESP